MEDMGWRDVPRLMESLSEQMWVLEQNVQVRGVRKMMESIEVIGTILSSIKEIADGKED